jgi:hypothetical protein
MNVIGVAQWIAGSGVALVVGHDDERVGPVEPIGQVIVDVVSTALDDVARKRRFAMIEVADNV